ncbi:MAG: ABC transporter [Planctomycetaceae bacterium]|jgi:ABC-type lipoprotein export system ATPase subunit|nr:ABC transporter [Planctomycetaceae bacterium]MBP61860.1 ABC transporter [Planctomycetaceae bacterium]
MLLELENVNKTFSCNDHPVRAVEDLSLQLDRGQFTAVCGPSGCGKSTLLLICGGLLRPETGTVTLHGHNLLSLSTENRASVRAAHIGFVFQQFHLVPYLNVLDNVSAASLGLRSGSTEDRGSMETRALELIDRFGLRDRIRHLPAEISTGERQRVALARALLNRPKLLLADEPTGNLDEDNSQVVLDHLQEFAAADGAVLLVTHDAAAASRADCLVRMAGGQIVDPVMSKGEM